MASVSRTTTPTVRRPALGRAVEVVVAATALVLVAPLLLVLAIAVRATSTGPALDRRDLRRVGDKRELLTLRTTVAGAESRSHARLVEVVGGGDIVTPLGQVLRRTRLDKLPRLVNVIRGDVTLRRALG